MSYKGIVIGIDMNSVTVMTKDNMYHKIKRKPAMYLSQEVEFKESDIINAWYIAKRLVALSAGFLILLGISLYFNLFSALNIGNEEFAYVCIEVNPSVEFTIDKSENVLKAEGQNSGTDEILQSMNLKGTKLEDALKMLMGKYDDLGIIGTDSKDYYLISGCVNPDSKQARNDIDYADFRIARILGNMEEVVNGSVSGNREVLMLKTEPAERKKAKFYNLSLGRYVLLSELNNKGNEISVEEVKMYAIKDLVELYKIKDANAYTASTLPVDVTPEPEISPLQTPIISEEPILEVSKEPVPEVSNVLVHTPMPTAVKTAEAFKTHTPKINTPLPLPTEEYKPGTGLRGEYYDNVDLTDLKLVRIDPVISFYWGNGVPGPEIRDNEACSIRWTGQIRTEHSEVYKFYVTRDNGVRLWIDNKLIIDKWDYGYNEVNEGAIYLESGRKYDIRIEYFNSMGQGFVILEWSSNSVDKAVIPRRYFYPSNEPIAEVKEKIPGDGIGLNCEYFDDGKLKELKHTGIDPTINFNWGMGTPHKNITNDQNFSIRWTGQIQPVYSEEYVFYLNHDDGVRLWINDKLVLDKWIQCAETISKTEKILLKKGKKYNIKLEYLNIEKVGLVRLEWSSPNTKKSIVPKSCLYPD